MKHILFVTIIIISLLLLTCSKEDSTTNPPPSTNYTPLPLKTGNTWIYIREGGLGGEEVYFLTDTIVNNRTVYKMPNDGYWFDVDKDAFYYDNEVLYGVRLYVANPIPEVVFPKNPSVGQTWNVKDYEMKLESINEQITVPAGTFDCYKISARETTSVSIKFDSWWSDGKGIIKLQSRTGSGLRELKSIILN